MWGPTATLLFVQTQCVWGRTEAGNVILSCGDKECQVKITNKQQ